MKKILSLVAMACMATVACSQKTINDQNAEKRTATGFHAIKVSGGIDLYLSQGEESIAVSASETRHRDRIKTEVVNGVLKIWYDHEDKNVRIDWGNRKLRAYVSFKNLDALEGSGGSDISVEGAIRVSKLKMDISGGSDFEGRVDINDLEIDQSGGSDVSISGKATNLVIDASGGSDCNGYELVSENCVIDATGGSDVTITVNKELKANASGGSDVHYKGNAKMTQAKSSGSSIKKVSK
jgi:hypothetical protein